MLTNSDLEKIKLVVDDRLKPVKEDIKGIDTVVEEKLKPIKQVIHGLDAAIEAKLKPIKNDLRWLKKTLDIFARNYDEGDIKLERRVTKIEKHLGLPQ